MAASSLVEPEFVAHLFAPVEGPDAAEALRNVRTLWEGCRSRLGMTQPIVEADLPADLPADLVNAPDGAVSGLQDPANQFQAIVRREHDVLNLSFGIAALDAVPRSRPWLAASIPPGWYEFTRWWCRLSETTTWLGSVAVYLAKSGDVSTIDLRKEVPGREDDADRWWESGFTLRDFAAWEVTPAGRHASRRLVLIAALDRDCELSGFAWSDGGTAMPPLCRYLMHAAKLRYLARVRGDGRDLNRLRERAAGKLKDLTDLLGVPDGRSQIAGRAADLFADEAALVESLAAMRLMRRSVDIARFNMVTALGEPLPADAGLAAWLSDQLADDTEYLEATREQVERLRGIVEKLGVHGVAPEPRPGTSEPRQRIPAPSRTGPDSWQATSGRRPEGKVEHRVGFGVDVVSYSSRSTPQQKQVQGRLAEMVEQVLADLGVPVQDTDQQPAGDGMMLVLPARVPAHIALPRLLHGWRARIATDSAAHPSDRIRLRLAIAAGPFTPAAVGFSGQTIIGIGRLLDSEPLRRAVTEHPDADLVALVSDRIYQDVVGERYPGLDVEDFQSVEVSVKTYFGRAWLWTGGELSRSPAAPRPGAGGVVYGSRDVFVIHGPHRQPRADTFELLRALGLRPLGWDDMVTRTGKPAPDREEVFAAALKAGPGVLVVMTPMDEYGDRSDVLMRAGRALALRPDHTILLEIGGVGPIADLNGRATVRLTDDTVDARIVFQHRIAQRLRLVGYPIDTSGTDWLDPQRFSGTVPPTVG